MSSFVGESKCFSICGVAVSDYPVSRLKYIYIKKLAFILKSDILNAYLKQDLIKSWSKVSICGKLSIYRFY